MQIDKTRKNEENNFINLWFEVIEVCSSSFVMELHNALDYSQIHHLFGSPGNISVAIFRNLQRVSVFACVVTFLHVSSNWFVELFS